MFKTPNPAERQKECVTQTRTHFQQSINLEHFHLLPFEMKVRFQLSITSQNPFTSSPKSVDLDGHTNILPGNIKYTKFLTF